MTVTETPCWELLVPHRMGQHDNSNPNIPRSNKTIPVPWHRDWDAFVIEISGGLTLQRAARGQWICPNGKLYKEIMIPVRIACTEEQIAIIADFTLEHYKQLAVFVTLISERTLIFSRE